MRVFKHYQDKGESTEEDLVKVATKLQNHLITNIILGENCSFSTLPYLDDDGSTVQVELADFIDKMLVTLFKRVSENTLAMIFPFLLKYQLNA